MEPAFDPSRDCLCLVCRQTGHIVEECPLYVQQCASLQSGSVPPPDVEPTRPSPPFRPPPAFEGSSAQAPLCQRCTQLCAALGRIATLHPFVLEDYDDNHSKRATKKTTQVPPLGPVRTLRLLATCPLCRLLFGISHLTDEELEVVCSGGELVIVTGWMVHRLERDLHWSGCEKGKGPYAKCVYTSVTRQPPGDVDGVWEPERLVEEAMDAMGFIHASPSDVVPVLGVRPVDLRTPDYSMIRGWLRRCDDLHHITCRPCVSENLKQIKLVDMATRQIVAYPTDGCDYIALSYVWGGVEQTNYKLGDTLPMLPATLEDAVVVALRLGKRYLWADSLCIDQESDVEKAEQIALMSAIYSGAWATIICLSGQSARSGLPRVSMSQDAIPQLSCEIWGKRLLSVMPTLSQQISYSPWASRAWTYQEGLLSSRRLFFTSHQVYFECNAVQCCESLDDSKSPFHLPSDEQRREALDEVVQDPNKSSIAGPEGVVGRGVLRDPFRPISHDEDAQIDDDSFAVYLRLVHSYTMKKMSSDADSLNAFSAMLMRLTENHYEGGFVQGLPVEDLPRALLWFHLALPRRRVCFPAWSWAGWEGEVNDSAILGAEDPDDTLMPPLRVWKAGRDGCPEPIYAYDPTPHVMKELDEANDEDDTDSFEGVDDADLNADSASGYESDAVTVSTDYGSNRASEDLDDDGSTEDIDLKNDPVFRLSRKVQETSPETDRNELLIEGITIQMSPVETPKDHYSDSETDDEPDGRCFIRLEGEPKPQRMRFYGHHAAQLASQRSNKQQEFLLVSREPHQSAPPKIYNALLLVDRDGDVAHRVGVASLRLDSVELLDRFDPVRRLFKLR